MFENEYSRQEDSYKQRIADLEEEKEQLQVRIRSASLLQCITAVQFVLFTAFKASFLPLNLTLAKKLLASDKMEALGKNNAFLSIISSVTNDSSDEL